MNIKEPQQLGICRTSIVLTMSSEPLQTLLLLDNGLWALLIIIDALIYTS